MAKVKKATQGKSSEDHLSVKSGKKWNSIEQYVEYLRHFMAYKYVKRFVKDNLVLEIGCGTGYGANYLSQYASDFIAIDISKRCVSYCHKHKKETSTFLQASGLNIPLKDGSVDVALSFQVIEHIEPRKVIDYLSEVKRVLKNESVFVVSTPNRKLRLLPFQKPWNPEHKKEYEYNDFKKMLNTVFEEVKVYGLKGSEEIQTIERNRVKQKPLNVYVISQLIPLMEKTLPHMILCKLKRVKNSFVRDRNKCNLVSEKKFKNIRISDFKTLSYCPKDCLDFYGVCKKTEKGNHVANPNDKSPKSFSLWHNSG